MSVIINGYKIIRNVKVIEPIYKGERLLGEIIAYNIIDKDNNEYTVPKKDLKRMIIDEVR